MRCLLHREQISRRYVTFSSYIELSLVKKWTISTRITPWRLWKVETAFYPKFEGIASAQTWKVLKFYQVALKSPWIFPVTEYVPHPPFPLGIILFINNVCRMIFCNRHKCSQNADFYILPGGGGGEHAPAALMLLCQWREVALSPLLSTVPCFLVSWIRPWIWRDICIADFFFLFPQSKHVMQEKQETLLDTINKLKSDVDKGKEKSTQQKAHIRDLQQV